jgi:hypothetical protein
MTNQVIKTLNSGGQLAFASVDATIFADETKTVTRNNRAKTYRDLWIRIKDSAEEKLIHLYPGDESFRYTIGQEVRLIFLDWEKTGLGKAVDEFVKDQAGKLEGIDGVNFQIQAIRNLSTGQTHVRDNLYTKNKFPFSWTISLVLGFGIAILYSLIFGYGGHRNEVAGWVGFWSVIAIRVGLSVAKYIKYSDVSDKTNSAVEELSGAQRVSLTDTTST